MDAKTAYEQYVESGADSLDSMDDVMTALRFAEEQPAEALTIRTRHERRVREQESKTLLRETWLQQGGDAVEFERQHKKLQDAQAGQRLRELDEESRLSFARDVVRGF
jgi:hypothetical protein